MPGRVGCLLYVSVGTLFFKGGREEESESKDLQAGVQQGDVKVRRVHDHQGKVAWLGHISRGQLCAPLLLLPVVDSLEDCAKSKTTTIKEASEENENETTTGSREGKKEGQNSATRVPPLG